MAPGPTRLMAARGLVPLPRPGELASVLYQLTFAEEPAVAQAARTSLDSPLQESVHFGRFRCRVLGLHLFGPDPIADRAHHRPGAAHL